MTDDIVIESGGVGEGDGDVKVSLKITWFCWKISKDYILGVVEGFYGKPWSAAERVRLFERMKEQKMNCYIYAPKDDEKHRAEWRTSYTENELAWLR